MPESLTRIEFNRLTRKIIGCSYEVGRILKYGFLEKVYENALAMGVVVKRLVNGF